MAASSSITPASRQPHNLPLPPSPEKISSQQNSNKKRKTGKEKAQDTNAPLPQRPGPVLEGDWNHAKAGTKPWQWAALTDSSASRYTPIFTKDGRCAFVSGAMFSTTEKDGILATSSLLWGHLSRSILVPLDKLFRLYSTLLSAPDRVGLKLA